MSNPRDRTQFSSVKINLLAGEKKKIYQLEGIIEDHWIDLLMDYLEADFTDEKNRKIVLDLPSLNKILMEPFAQTPFVWTNPWQHIEGSPFIKSMVGIQFCDAEQLKAFHFVNPHDHTHYYKIISKLLHLKRKSWEV